MATSSPGTRGAQRASLGSNAPSQVAIDRLVGSVAWAARRAKRPPAAPATVLPAAATSHTTAPQGRDNMVSHLPAVPHPLSHKRCQGWRRPLQFRPGPASMRGHLILEPVSSLVMRILVIAPVAPLDARPPYGGAETRVRELSTRLSRSHEIAVVALSGDKRSTGLAGSPSEAGPGLSVTIVPRTKSRVAAVSQCLLSGTSLYAQLYRSPEFASAVSHHLTSGEFDLVQCEFPYMARYCLDLRVPWILVEHNIEFALSESLREARPGAFGLPYRLYAGRETRKRRGEEIEACRAASAVVVMSEPDRSSLLSVAPGLRVSVVPNGVDLDFYQPSEVPASAGRSARPTAVFIGRMDYRPNIDGARWFCNDVLPLIRRRIPDLTLWIVGAAPHPAVLSLGTLPGVQVTGEVPDTRPFLTRASVVVVPLLAGSGTRLKILEAFAIGRPVVTTTIGYQGIAATPGEHLLVADSPEGFAETVVGLVESPQEQRRLALAARELAEQRYGWESSARLMERVYTEVLAQSASSSS